MRRSCTSTSPTRTTTAASSRSAPTASSTSAWATAAPAATRRTRSEPRRSGWASSCALDVTQRAPNGEIAGYGLRNPWRFSFDRRPAISGSATSARASWRRSTSSPPGQRGLATTAGTSFEGRQCTSDRSPTRRGGSSARSPSTPIRKAARSPAASSTAAATCRRPRPLLLRRLLQRARLEPRGARRQGRGRTPRALRGAGALVVRRGRPRRASTSFLSRSAYRLASR